MYFTTKIKNRFIVFAGGFLFGLIVGFLVWGAGIEIKVNRDKQTNFANQSKKGFVVKSVFDGDSILLANGEEVRLLGIDSTEFGEECFAEAKQYLSGKILNKQIKLTTGTEDRDKYDRLLRWVWSDNENINIKLVEEGLAKAYLYGELEFADALIDAEAQARDEGSGCLWSRGNLAEDLPTIDYTQTSDWLGETVKVTGVIDNVFKSAKGNIFINFCADFKTCPFSSVIFISDQHRFESLPDSSWQGREVAIIGEIEEYEGRSEIIISNPDQIELLP